MSGLILPIVLLIIVAIFGVVFFIVTKKQESTIAKNQSKESSNKKNNNDDSKTSKEEVNRQDIFKFMEFDRILNNMIVQNKGTRFTMAIKCKGINYDLMSEVEQMAVEDGFIMFLNTLKFPIQLYVQAQNIDLKSAIAQYKENVSGIQQEFMKIDHEYTRTLERFDATEEEVKQVENERNKVLNVYEYASDIINYVERMSTNKSLLQRNFYILVSYTTSEVSAADRFTKDELLNICYTELLTRCQGIINSLASSSVEGKILESNELADLLYTAYNRDDKGLMSVKEAINSGFYRLYSTSKDSFYKRNKAIKEEIEAEAKVKAITALKQAIKNGTYTSETTEALYNQEQISKTAVDMIKKEELPEDIKNNAKKMIIDDYKNIKKVLVNQIENEKREILEQPVDGVTKQNISENTNNTNNTTINNNTIINDNSNKTETISQTQRPTSGVSRNIQIETPSNSSNVSNNSNIATENTNTQNTNVTTTNNTSTNEDNNLFTTNNVNNDANYDDGDAPLFETRLGNSDDEEDELI